MTGFFNFRVTTKKNVNSPEFSMNSPYRVINMFWSIQMFIKKKRVQIYGNSLGCYGDREYQTGCVYR
jgi:hypothetical protein